MSLTELLDSIKHECPCREEQSHALLSLLGRTKAFLPSGLFLHGHTSTGKSHVLHKVLQRLGNGDRIKSAVVHFVECFSPRYLFETILEQLGSSERCDNPNAFILSLKKLVNNQQAICIVLDKAERLRDLNDGKLLPMLLALQQYSGLSVCVILVSEVTWEKFRFGTGCLEPIKIFFPQYDKDELLEILAKDCPPNEDENFYKTYLSMVLGVLLLVCRDLSEIRHISLQHWGTFKEPVAKQEASKSDVRKLWRHLEPHLRQSLSQVYLRGQEDSSPSGKVAIELPFFSKYLLIAAYLASYNPARYDRRLFVKAKDGKKKSKISKLGKKGKLHSAQHLLGPKAFPLDRVLAIFYSIVEEKVIPSANLFVQISSLVSLKLIVPASSGGLLESVPKYRCNVGFEVVKSVSKTVGFEVQRYLHDSA